MSKSKLREGGSFLSSEEFSKTSEYREAIGIFEKWDKSEVQEAVSCWSSNWLLSGEEMRGSCGSGLELPPGLCRGLGHAGERLVVLLPCPESEETYQQQQEALIDYREIYQVLRELTVAMFGFCQLPGLQLEPNHDRSSQVQLPPAYTNSRLGQLMLGSTLTLHSLWHGTAILDDRRAKWTDKWRATLAVNIYGQPETKRDILQEFRAAGLVNVTDVEEWQHAYDNCNQILERENLLGDSVIAEFQRQHSNMDMHLIFRTTRVQRHEEVFVLQSDWTIETVLRSIAEDDDRGGQEDPLQRVSRILRIQKDSLLRPHLTSRPDTRRQLMLLSLIAPLVPLLVGLKKRMRIPNIRYMMNPLLGDELRTDREVPPMVTGVDCPNVLFRGQKEYYGVRGGVEIGLATPDVDPVDQDLGLSDEDVNQRLMKVADEAGLIAASESTYTDKNPVRIFTDKAQRRYYVVPLYTETYYHQAPRSPAWVRAISDESAQLQTKRLPLSDNALFDQFKRFYGLTGAMNNKNPVEALRSCSRRGLVAMLLSVARRCSVSRISKQDERGWALMHLAAMHNKVHIVGALVAAHAQDLNVRRYNTISDASPTPLHVASLCGSLDAVSALIGLGANLRSADKSGWTAAHCAAYADQPTILALLIRHDPDLINVPTRTKLGQSPILIAAGAGSLDCVQLLERSHASLVTLDTEQKGIAHMAVLYLRYQLLEYLIQHSSLANDNCPSLSCAEGKPLGSFSPIWPVLLEMLKSENQLFVLRAVQCLQYLTKYSDSHWKSVLNYGLVEGGIVRLLDKRDDISLLEITAGLLCNICVHSELQLCLAETALPYCRSGAVCCVPSTCPELDQLTLKSQLAFVVGRLCQLTKCQLVWAQLGGHTALERLLDEVSSDHCLGSTEPQVVQASMKAAINAVDAVNALCLDNSDNQKLIIEQTSIGQHLIRFLNFRDKPLSEDLTISASLAISSVANNNNTNKNFFVANKVVKGLLGLVRHKANVRVQVAAATAVERLSVSNRESRTAFLAVETEFHLIHLLKIWSVEVKEQGVRSLWALAGDHISGQRFIAERVGPGLLIELIMTKSAVLQAIGCSAIAALCREVKLKQNLIMREGGVQPLVRLLRQASSSHSVLTTAVQTVGVLCVGIAHCNNRELQTQLAGEDALHTLVQLYQMHETDLPLKIAVGHTLASLILSHKENEARLDRIFDFTDLLTLVDDIDDKVLLLHCLTSLAVFGFNNTGKQFRLREKGGLQFDVFQPFLESDDAVENCQAAFNMVVLARDIVTHDQVTITARAVRIMVSNLQSPENHVVILTASLIASLCHTRAGIPDAFVSLGVVPLLLGLLHSQNTEVRASVAVALGYLSFNGTAARTMLKECRIEFELFGLLRAEIAQMDSRICSEFVQAYLKTERVGLPYKFLECNGGHPILPSPERFRIKSSVARPVSHSDSSSSPRQQQLTKPRPKTAGGLSSGPSHKR